MKIVLDTNILRQDLLLRSRKFEMLIDYVSKTEANIVLPAVVYEELQALYVRLLKDGIQKFRRSGEMLRQLTVEATVPRLEIDWQQQMDNYVDYFRRKLHITDLDIIPYKNEYLPDLVHRAVTGRRPFSLGREEFRDGVTWLTLLDIAGESESRAVTFVSRDTTDFAGADKALHSDLRGEAEARGVTVHYFSSLDDFLKSHAVPIEFVTREWILDSFDTSSFQLELEREVQRYGESALSRWLDKQDPLPKELLSANSTSMDLFDFYVYEMADGSIRIEATFENEFEIEYRVEQQVIDHWEYELQHNFTDESDFDLVPKSRLVPNNDHKYAYLVIQSELHMIAKDKKITSIELVNWFIS